MINGLIITFVYGFLLTKYQAQVIIGVLLILLLPIDLFRLKFKKFNNFMIQNFHFLFRENEKSELSAQFYYLLGVAFLVFCLPKIFALHGILCLSLLDPIAAMVGIKWGRITWNNIFTRFFQDFPKLNKIVGTKTVEGTFAGFIMALIAGAMTWFLPWSNVGEVALNISFESKIYLSVLVAIVASAAEAWPSQWDDNAVVPFFSGLVSTILYLILS